MSYKEQELLIFRKHLGSRPIFGCASSSFSVVCYMVCLRPVSWVLITTSAFSNVYSACAKLKQKSHVVNQIVITIFYFYETHTVCNEFRPFDLLASKDLNYLVFSSFVHECTWCRLSRNTSGALWNHQFSLGNIHVFHGSIKLLKWEYNEIELLH